MTMLPGVHLSLRSMLVTGGLDSILVSPIASRDEEAHVGEHLTTLVAPSLLHHVFLARALARYRPVSLWGPPGLLEKRPELGPIRVFGVDAWPHASVLEPLVIEGAPIRNEVVFFHRESRSLYTADLVFNIQETRGFLAPLAFRAMGVHKRLAMMKMWKRWVTDVPAFRRSIDKLLAWDFDQIIVAHGDIQHRNGRALIEAAVRERDLR